MKSVQFSLAHNDKISKDAQDALKRIREQYPSSPVGFGQYYFLLVSNYLHMQFALYGFIGLLLFPVHFVSQIVLVVVKLILLNPPGLSKLQGSVTFESRLPYIADTKKFSDGFYFNYDKTRQSKQLRAVKSTFIAFKTLFWEKMALYPYLIFPLSVSVYEFSTETDSALIDLPLWAFHAFYGYICIFRDKETHQVIVCGELPCWGMLKPVYNWVVKKIFGLFNPQIY